ncbi:MAG: hypothetical protein ACYTGX_12425 [Planctomycetota bacterium]|jgi:hypothetical protein
MSFVWTAALAACVGCAGGETGGEKPGPDGGEIPAGEREKIVMQLREVLDEEHPPAFPGDPESLAWEQRKKEATDQAVALGEHAVPALAKLLAREPARPGERIAQVLAAAALAEIDHPSAVTELRRYLDVNFGGDVEVEVLCIEGIGAHGTKDDLERLRGYLGDAPANKEVMSGPAKRAAEALAMKQNAAAESMARLGDYDGIPMLFGNLGGGGWARRDAAIRFQRLTGKRFQFALDAPRPLRHATIQQAKAWWEANKAGFTPVALPPKQAHDIYVKPASPNQPPSQPKKNQ